MNPQNGRYALNTRKEQPMVGMTDAQMNRLHEAADRTKVPALSDAAVPRYEQFEEPPEPTHDELLQRLQSVLLDISASDLARIGVTIKREEGEWAWLVEAMAVALDRCDRGKPAAQLRKNTSMERGVTISITKHFLIELAKLLDERSRNFPDPTSTTDIWEKAGEADT